MSPRIASLESRPEPHRRQRLAGLACRWLGRGDLSLSPGHALEQVLARERDLALPLELAELGGAFLKGGPLRGGAAWRRGLASRLGAEPPRLREYQNLRSLRSLGFLAPEPLQAGAAFRGPRLVAQWLLTARLDGSGTLEASIAPTDLGATLTRRRAASLAAVARSVGRLHGLGWFHGDLYPRNLLLVGPGSQVEAAFIDLWRGGPMARPAAGRLPARWMRGFARDLGCFFLHGALWLLPGEQRAFLARYLASLAETLEQRGLPSPPRAQLLGAIAAARAAERERFAADPRRQAGRPLPPEHWSPPPPAELDWPLRSPGPA
jgi:hypothetical protein